MTAVFVSGKALAAGVVLIWILRGVSFQLAFAV